MNKKIALVTWWCSGIWESISKKLAREWIIVIVNYVHNVKKAKQTVKDIISDWWKAIKIKADISKKWDVKKMFQKIKKKYGKLDYLVNNAWIDVMMDFEDFDEKIRKKIIDINLMWKFLCTKYSISLLKQSQKPKIINIASRLWTKPMSRSVAYCCAEAWVIMLTKVIAVELKKYNIISNTVSPWLTRTPLSKWVYKNIKQREKTKKCTPMWRIWKPEDIANMIKFLLSDEASYIDWENINVSWWNLLT